ncbi:bifunctional folylpolyglutamate synthase/dihydrofolate synthase [Paenilisteria rocourtiae]|uniref:Dihydrofolate synthase/folylpolyglutamate synthase n=1 Tax=Listeria rocourtiae TaxID=647910 RepID=A0A4R6ZMA9_9LIST|nr:folylpolyglutamate synthase/dihydrofolate synthase family protein [Listeria rocourtiae]MBC1603920.1 bifunctional folylpolyglutamate synthase/dihydrofolate synthase [Listeria rocourtiae]TDR53573.1 dihydrofolate synthase/folylpolyglutamate synthase [Listeria rocourtiae]
MSFHNYTDALQWIHGTLRMGIKPGLMRMEWMLAKLDHPENKNKWVHIAGTNGKGSTLTFLRNILEQSGYRVGTFTSPYIEIFNERISVDGIPIADEMIVKLCNRIKPLADELDKTEFGHPSEFEIITVMMFLYFAEYDNIDIGLVEVGLGGRLDSTNVITPLISVVTTIGMDHMEFLGDSLQSIAKEKAGIFKKHIPVVSGVLQPEIRAMYKGKSISFQSDLYQLSTHFFVQKQANEMFNYRTSTQEIRGIEVGLIGDHQLNNAAVAIKTSELLLESGFAITEDAIKQGVKLAEWPGRMEQVNNLPLVFLDGAHNLEGMQVLVNSAIKFRGAPVKVLFTAMRDKSFVEMIDLLKRIEDVEIVITTFDYPRSLTIEEINQIANTNNIASVENWEGILRNWIKAEKEEVILVTGSLYFISEVRKKLLKY